MAPILERQLRGVKKRLLWVVVFFSLGSGLAWYYNTEIFHILLAPAHGRLSVDGRPIFTAPTDMFTAVFSLVVKGGILSALPVAVFQVYRFVRPWLGARRRRLVHMYAALAATLWAGGTAFAYFILLPTGMRFLLSYGTEIATPYITITEYLGLVMAMLFWMGLVFQLPVVMMLLAHLRLVSHAKFRKVPRRYITIAAFTFSMFITPTTDWVNQTLVAVPLILLYEVGWFLAWLVRPREKG